MPPPEGDQNLGHEAACGTRDLPPNQPMQEKSPKPKRNEEWHPDRPPRPRTKISLPRELIIDPISDISSAVSEICNGIGTTALSSA